MTCFRALALVLMAPSALAFLPESTKTVSLASSTATSTTRSLQPLDSRPLAWSNADSACRMAFTTADDETTTNMFDGPLALTKERDACGVGFVANPKLGGRFGSHKILQQGLSALGCMEHRGGCGGDGVSGDGAGIMTTIPWDLFKDFVSEDCPQP